MPDRSLRLRALAFMALAALGCSSAGGHGSESSARPVATGAPVANAPMSLRFRPRTGDALWVSGQFTPFDVELLGGPAHLQRAGVSWSCTTVDPRGPHGIGINDGPAGSIAGEQLERRWLVQPLWVPTDATTTIPIACDVRALGDGGVASSELHTKDVLPLPAYERPKIAVASVALKRCNPAWCAAVRLNRSSPPGYGHHETSVECAFVASFGHVPKELEGLGIERRFSSTWNERTSTDGAEIMWREPLGPEATRSLRVSCRATEPNTWETSEKATEVVGKRAPIVPLGIARIQKTGGATSACFGCDQPSLRPAGYRLGLSYKASAEGTALVVCTAGDEGKVTLTDVVSVRREDVGKELEGEVDSPFPDGAQAMSPGTIAGPPPMTGVVRCRAYSLPDFVPSADATERVTFRKT